MLKEERQQHILQKLHYEYKVSSIDLSVELAVSEDTIRRDLGELAEKGLLKKVYGGAVPTSVLQLTFNERTGKAIEEKIKMAQKVLPFFENDQLLLLDGGTTNLQVARMLPANLQLTVATNSIPVAMELINHPNINILLIGGKVLREEQVSTGTQVVGMLDTLHADICLIGVCSIDPVTGLTVPDYEQAIIKRKMIQTSTRVIAMATTEKLGTTDHYRVCGLEELYRLVTPFEPASDVLQDYANRNINLL